MLPLPSSEQIWNDKVSPYPGRNFPAEKNGSVFLRRRSKKFGEKRSLPGKTSKDRPFLSFNCGYTEDSVGRFHIWRASRRSFGRAVRSVETAIQHELLTIFVVTYLFGNALQSEIEGNLLKSSLNFCKCQCLLGKLLTNVIGKKTRSYSTKRCGNAVKHGFNTAAP